MRIFVAGASGAIGSRLVPLLVDAGHEVAAMTRMPEKADALAASGAVPMVCDVFDAARLQTVVRDFAPDVVMHQLTDMPDDPSLIAKRGAAQARIRYEGTDNLVDAARAAGVAKLVAQSVAWELPGRGGEAIAHLEEVVLAYGGVVLRYGLWYGTGTYHASNDPPPKPRVHIDVAASRTVAMLGAAPGIYTIVEE
jgi:nucleoside-diphosphate-sugar epimerase